MVTMEERINQAFSYLMGEGIVHTKKEIAEKMGASAPNVSSASKGKKYALTKSFLIRFNAAFEIKIKFSKKLRVCIQSFLPRGN